MSSLNSNLVYNLIKNLISETVCFFSLNSLYSLKYQNIILIRIKKENNNTIRLQKSFVALDFKTHNDENILTQSLRCTLNYYSGWAIS